MFAQMVDEFVGLSAAELDAAIAAAELDRRAAEARLAAASAVVAARGTYRDDGHQSMRSYLKATLNCSGTAANKIRRRAAAIDQHPAVGDALLAGHIGSEQVDLLAKAQSHPVAGEQFPAFEAQLLDHAEHFGHDDFSTIVTHFIERGDPDGSFDDQQFRDDERSATVTIVDGAISAHASGGSPQAAAEMFAIFQAAVEAEFQKDCATRRAQHGEAALAAPLPRTSQQRKFDALHSIFMNSVAVPADAKTPEPLVNILIDHVTAGLVLHDHGLIDSPDLLDIGNDALATSAADLLNRTCSINGTPMHPDVALRSMLTGRVRRAIVDADRVVIDLGRTQRLFTGKAREAAQLLAVTCTHAGCDVPARLCDVDHREEWVNDHGATDQHNAMPACGVHDRWKHANKIRSRRSTSGRIYLIRPDGTPVLAVGEREPEWVEPAPNSARSASPDPWDNLHRLEPSEFAAHGISADYDSDIPIYSISYAELTRHRNVNRGGRC